MSKNILVVEDEDFLRQIYAEVLPTFEAHVICAEDGLEAIGFIKSEHIDFIILDWNLPRGGGKSVIDFMQCNKINIPIVLATGNASFIPYEYHLFHCVCGVFEKPFFMRDIVVYIEQHFQRH